MDTATTQPQPIDYPPPVLAGEGEDAGKWAWNINPDDEFSECLGVQT
jgi:hypothetical protein